MHDLAERQCQIGEDMRAGHIRNCFTEGMLRYVHGLASALLKHPNYGRQLELKPASRVPRAVLCRDEHMKSPPMFQRLHCLSEQIGHGMVGKARYVPYFAPHP